MRRPRTLHRPETGVAIGKYAERRLKFLTHGERVVVRGEWPFRDAVEDLGALIDLKGTVVGKKFIPSFCQSVAYLHSETAPHGEHGRFFRQLELF